MSDLPLPPSVPTAEWHREIAALRKEEKALTRQLDAVNARRRRLPMTPVELESTFNEDMGATVDGEENHMLSVFLRDGDAVWRTYFTEDRGVEHLGSHWTYLDLTPYGRQEVWEDSPPGWPQDPTYAWHRRHDEYWRE